MTEICELIILYSQVMDESYVDFPPVVKTFFKELPIKQSK